MSGMKALHLSKKKKKKKKKKNYSFWGADEPVILNISKISWIKISWGEKLKR